MQNNIFNHPLDFQFQHPIDSSVRLEIEAQLAQIEKNYNVRILYACESGSRGWGFASPDSDYDVRFIYVHDLPWYLKVSESRDVIELPISNELDICGWDLRKTLQLLKKGNATLIEWLRSPVVYQSDALFLEAIKEAILQTHQPERSFYHYIHMAYKNYREYLTGETVRLKKYLYVLRPLLAALWIEQKRSVAPMRFEELLNAIVTDNALREAIDRLLDIKRSSNESEYGKPFPVINAFIEKEIIRLKALAIPASHAIDFTILDDLLKETILRFSR